jgi:hypothetical protein
MGGLDTGEFLDTCRQYNPWWLPNQLGCGHYRFRLPKHIRTENRPTYFQEIAGFRAITRCLTINDQEVQAL